MTRSVTIVGAGPAGLTAARVLRAAGLDDVLVLERNPVAGGLPRFCGHRGWGMLDFHRVWTGPRYAAALVAQAGTEIATNATVLGLEPGGGLRVAFPDGVRTTHSRAVLLATGVRETPRSARLVSGTRPWGVTTTGAFQEMVSAGQIPFRRPVIIGTELVAFSALVTARHVGITPVAIIEAASRITARRPGDLVARVLFGVPVHVQTRLVAIQGQNRVEAVVVEQAGIQRMIACDGVVFTGGFVPEAVALRGGVVALDPATGGPVVDNHSRCSDPAFFAAGNLLRGVEHSGFVAAEGRRAAESILRSFAGTLPVAAGQPVTCGAGLRYVYPQRVLPAETGRITLFARADGPHRGRLRVLADDAVLADRAVNALPERRLSLTIPAARLRVGQTLRMELHG